MLKKSQLKYYILLVAGIIVLINLLAGRFFFRLDFTEDQRYTLSHRITSYNVCYTKLLRRRMEAGYLLPLLDAYGAQA